MNALKYFEPIPDHKTVRNIQQKSPRIMKREVQRQRKKRLNSHIEQAMEVMLKITINGLFTFVAFSALMKLMPYHQSQQEELAEISQEVMETEKRVQKLRQNFSRNFDPTQTKKVMQANTHKVDPNQLPIFFIE